MDFKALVRKTFTLTTWHEKLAFLDAGNGIDPVFLACNFDLFEPNHDGVGTLAESISWLPASYLEFLRFTNGAALGMFVLFGVEGETVHQIQNEIKLHGFPITSRIPIGKDPGGATFFLNKDGKVETIFEAVHYVSSSFSEFLNFVLLGAGYKRVMTGLNDDDWYQFLVGQGWTDTEGDGN